MRFEQYVLLIGGVIILAVSLFLLVINIRIGVCSSENICPLAIVIVIGIVFGFWFICQSLNELSNGDKKDFVSPQETKEVQHE